MGLRPLPCPGNAAGFDILLSVIPSAACIAAEDGQHNGYQSGTDNQTADKGRSEEEACTHRHHNRQQRRQLHLRQRPLVGNTDAGLIIRLLRPVQDARPLPELAADLADHLTGRLGHGVDQHTGEQEGQRAADNGAGQDHGGHHIEDQVGAHLIKGIEIGNHQRQSGQRAGADGEALADGGGGIAHGVQRVGNLPDAGLQAAHLGNAAGVVRNGAVGIHGDRGRDKGQHTHGGHGDAVHAGYGVGCDDTGSQNNTGNHTGPHAQRQALGDGQRRAFLRRLGQPPGRLIVRRRIELRQHADDDAGDDADGRGDPGGKAARRKAQGGLQHGGVFIAEQQPGGQQSQ